MSNKKTILIVDDDQGIRNTIQEYLNINGYNAISAADSDELKHALNTTHVDLITLDVMMPKEDGISIIRQLKHSINTPIIILSANGNDIDKIVGLEVGADDYLSKPFNPRELLARINSLLRRTSQIKKEQIINTYSFGPYLMNIDARTLYKDSVELTLTSSEFELLNIFTKNPNKVLTRDKIMDLSKGYERDVFDRSVDIRINRLRKKIEQQQDKPIYIKTSWGKGYMFTPQGG